MYDLTELRQELRSYGRSPSLYHVRLFFGDDDFPTETTEFNRGLMRLNAIEEITGSAVFQSPQNLVEQDGLRYENIFYGERNDKCRDELDRYSEVASDVVDAVDIPVPILTSTLALHVPGHCSAACTNTPSNTHPTPCGSIMPSL